ncbi:MAG: hypothetical protein H6R42_79 [Nitrospirae bacterium]|jgi:hypothetical protein|nr:hypothetical protein [Nitrospirota bacterium]
MIIKWNVTSGLNKYKTSDVLILSVGKSGRTWLRVLLNKYLSLHYNVPFELCDLRKFNKKIPSLLFSHELWLHFSDASWIQRILGKYIIPDNILVKKKIILLSRDPRDIVVSLYYQKTKRSKKKIACDMKEFIKHKRYGIRTVVNVMNIWHRRLNKHPQCLLIRYEDMKRDAPGELMRLLIFLGIENINIDSVREAVAFADFDNMKRMELKGEFHSRVLMPSDPSDPNSFKVREGKVGGYIRHFCESDSQYLDDAVKMLAQHYRYGNR